jgi:murein DD-endopeptidase MepM/ murein hydrolase activator NlpD
MMSRRTRICLLLLIPAASAGLFAQYPQIRALDRGDPLFFQMQGELSAFYKTAAKPGASEFPPVSLFLYQVRDGEDLFSLSARLNVAYDALVTLNGAETREIFERKHTVLVPSQPGTFVRDPPQTQMEELMLSQRMQLRLPSQSLTVRLPETERAQPMRFFPGDAFSKLERLYFLRVLFAFPVARGTISSPFGSRSDPFSGYLSFHNGVDIAAAVGSEVVAAQDGTVAETGADETLGNYVVLSHANGYRTVYGHLSALTVKTGENVAKGMTIGKVGLTGRTTGPHLHFEIREKGDSRDPLSLMSIRR